MVIYHNVGNQGNDKAGDPMIETLVMSLPSDVTKAIIDIAVVLGESAVLINAHHMTNII